jgi:hypothetical protein
VDSGRVGEALAGRGDLAGAQALGAAFFLDPLPDPLPCGERGTAQAPGAAAG